MSGRGGELLAKNSKSFIFPSREKKMLRIDEKNTIAQGAGCL